MTGIEYPTITVGTHKDLVVRQSLVAELLIGRRGLSMATIHIAIHPWKTDAAGINTQPLEANPDYAQNNVTAFSCFVAENFIDATSYRVSLDSAPSADYWATQIVDLAPIAKVVREAIKKASEDSRKKLAAVPPQETEAAS